MSQRRHVDRHSAVPTQDVECALNVGDRHRLALRRPLRGDDDDGWLHPEDPVHLTGRRPKPPTHELGEDGDGLAMYSWLRSWRREEGRHGGLQRSVTGQRRSQLLDGALTEGRVVSNEAVDLAGQSGDWILTPNKVPTPAADRTVRLGRQLPPGRPPQGKPRQLGVWRTLAHREGRKESAQLVTRRRERPQAVTTANRFGGGPQEDELLVRRGPAQLTVDLQVVERLQKWVINRRRLRGRGGVQLAVGPVALREQHGQPLSVLGVDARETRQLDGAYPEGPLDLRPGHRHGLLGLAEYFDGDERDIPLRVWPRDVIHPAWTARVSGDPTPSEPSLLGTPDEQLVAFADAERCRCVRAEERCAFADLPVVPLLEGDRSDPMRHSSAPSGVRSG
ncbi:hypothetical protein SAMN04488085_11063 [Geodermatophilus ruber]|uniref:Uncharacterized protein n=1 Tax=Geodermatophilus ruber TaxID=504800 RepID=A0A1I4H6N2_9ACTN|nr:hypothetical protein SAMN04488085_11063 [Geodermatophilus ruber]